MNSFNKVTDGTKTFYAQRFANYIKSQSLLAHWVIFWEWVLNNVPIPKNVLIKNPLERKVFYELCHYYDIKFKKKCLSKYADYCLCIPIEGYGCVPYGECKNKNLSNLSKLRRRDMGQDTVLADDGKYYNDGSVKYIEMPVPKEIILSFPKKCEACEKCKKNYLGCLNKRGARKDYFGCLVYGDKYDPKINVPKEIVHFKIHLKKSTGKSLEWYLINEYLMKKGFPRGLMRWIEKHYF